MRQRVNILLKISTGLTILYALRKIVAVKLKLITMTFRTNNFNTKEKIRENLKPKRTKSYFLTIRFICFK